MPPPGNSSAGSSTAARPPQQSRNSYFDTFSPVNENGSFDFDRIVKSGIVQKRTRTTKAWKKVYLVLRPNHLSIYRNEREVKLRHKINLSDLTAVAYLNDPKREYVFGLFTPAKNYHLEAPSEREAIEWVGLIRREARIDEAEAEMSLASPSGTTYQGFGRYQMQKTRQPFAQDERLASSSPEPLEIPSHSYTTKEGVRVPAPEPPSSNTFDSNGMSSFSDFSDAFGSTGFRDSSVSLPDPRDARDPALPAPTMPINTNKAPTDSSKLHLSQSNPTTTDPNQENERVIWQGYLHCLKSKGGVRQWKKLWAVLRPKKLTLYKSDDEYAVTLLIPLSSIINAVEIDPISKTKAHCMQIIAEDKSFRFCAPDEQSLEKWLGALKSRLAKRKEGERMRKLASLVSVAP